MIRSILLLTALSVPLFAADETVIETRRHSAVVIDGQQSYVVTTIRQLSEPAGREILLVKSANGDRYQFSRIRSYVEQLSVYEIKDLDRDAFIRSSMKWPYKAKTRTETAKEIHAIQAANADMPTTIVKLEVDGMVRTANETEWQNPAVVRKWRSEIRTVMNPFFLEGLENLREQLLPQSGFVDFDLTLVKLISHAPSCDVKPVGQMVDLAPDCRFDSSMGFPCNDEQRQNADDAAKLPATEWQY